MRNFFTLISIAFLLQLFCIPLQADNTRHAISRFQNRIESAKPSDKVILLDSLSRIYWYIWPDSSLMFSNEALDIAKTFGNDYLLGEAYNSVGNAYLFLNENKMALANYQKSKIYREKASNMRGIALSLNNIAMANTRMSQFTESINIYKEAIDICEGVEDYNTQAYIFMNLADTYKAIHESSKALECALKAANTYIHYKNKSQLANVYTFIGNLHRELENYSLALEYYLKTYEFYYDLNNERGLAGALINIGIAYDGMNQPLKAIDYYNESLVITEKLGEKANTSAAYNNIGFVYAKLNNYKEALECYKKSLLISIELKDLVAIMNTSNNIASIELKTGNLDRAFNYVNQAMMLEDKVPDLLLVAESHEILAGIMEQKGRLKEAIFHKNRLIQLKDSLYNRERNKKLLETQMRFETEKKNKEIELLKRDNAINKLLIQKQHYIQTLLIFSILLLISFVVFFYRVLVSKKKANNQLARSNELLETTNKELTQTGKNLKEINATKDKFFSIVAHDIKNPLSTIMGFSEILNRGFDSFNEKEKKSYIKIVYDSSVSLYRLLENLLHWSRSQLGTLPMRPELTPLQPIVDSELQLMEPTAQGKGIKTSIRVDSHLMAYIDKDSISLVIRNLIGNAIKFSNTDGKISITAEEKDQTIQISISDTGTGMNQLELDQVFALNSSFSKRGTANEEGSGLGLILCKELVEKNGGSINVQSAEGEGSTFTIKLPTNRWA